MFQYGTLGYAAPENYVKPINDSKYPLDKNKVELGKMTIESDIFLLAQLSGSVLIFLNCIQKAESLQKIKVRVDHMIITENMF